MYSSKGKCYSYSSMHVVLPFMLFALVQDTKNSSVYVPCMQLQRRVQ